MLVTEHKSTQKLSNKSRALEYQDRHFPFYHFVNFIEDGSGVGPNVERHSESVFHMHFETHNTGEWPMVHNNGHTYMVVPGFWVFHGQKARSYSPEPNVRAWRVQGGEGTTLTARNGRLGLLVGRPADQRRRRLACAVAAASGLGSAALARRLRFSTRPAPHHRAPQRLQAREKGGSVLMPGTWKLG